MTDGSRQVQLAPVSMSAGLERLMEQLDGAAISAADPA
jgi:hypothetical protein